MLAVGKWNQDVLSPERPEVAPKGPEETGETGTPVTGMWGEPITPNTAGGTTAGVARAVTGVADGAKDARGTEELVGGTAAEAEPADGPRTGAEGVPAEDNGNTPPAGVATGAEDGTGLPAAECDGPLRLPPVRLPLRVLAPPEGA